MPRLCVLALAVGLFMITVVGCGNADPQSSGSKVTPVAGGTTTCDYRLVSAERDADGADNILERWTCTVEMSDGRVSGTEELEFMTRWFPGDPAGVATGEGVLTTEQGVWRGGGEALVDFPVTRDSLC